MGKKGQLLSFLVKKYFIGTKHAYFIKKMKQSKEQFLSFFCFFFAKNNYVVVSFYSRSVPEIPRKGM